MEEKKCKKCNGNGNRFVRNDYGDRYLRSFATRKGKAGKWVKCRYCYGTGSN